MVAVDGHDELARAVRNKTFPIPGGDRYSPLAVETDIVNPAEHLSPLGRDSTNTHIYPLRDTIETREKRSQAQSAKRG